MRKTDGAIIACSILAGVLAVGAVAQADTCQAGNYTVSTSGPVAGASTTSITYTISGNPGADHVAAVVASGSTNCVTPSITSVVGIPGSGNQAYAPAVGDPVTGLGKMSCHDEAAKINPNGSVVNFTITVSGVRAPAPRTVVVKKGNTIKGCEIVGIGDPAPVPDIAPVTETIKEPGSDCAVEFTLDRITGNVIHAEVVSQNPECKLTQTPVENLNLSVSGVTDCPPANVLQDGSCSLGPAKFGEGYVHSGSASCTTRIIGGKLYSWGAPCP